MHSHDNDAPVSTARRHSLGWHKPKRVLVGSLIHKDQLPQPGDPLVPCISTARCPPPGEARECSNACSGLTAHA